MRLTSQMPPHMKIGFLGAGKMATALAKGFLQSRILEASGLTASDIDPSARAHFAQEAGARMLERNVDVVRASNIVVLAVKPNQVEALLAEIKSAFKPGQLLISIAAGITIAKLEGGLAPKARVIRVMPNTPALVGASATGFSLGKAATSEDAALAQRLFEAVGVAFQVKEDMLNAVTGLSGSGPAYVYLMIEALSDGGVAAGLPRDVSTRLAAQTLLGGARMVLETGLHPGALKDMVTSPGGTTIEAIHRLEQAGVRGALMTAVRAAADKAKQLG